jgi:hypothetical protein
MLMIRNWYRKLKDTVLYWLTPGNIINRSNTSNYLKTSEDFILIQLIGIYFKCVIYELFSLLTALMCINKMTWYFMI